MIKKANLLMLFFCDASIGQVCPSAIEVDRSIKVVPPGWVLSKTKRNTPTFLISKLVPTLADGRVGLRRKMCWRQENTAPQKNPVIGGKSSLLPGKYDFCGAETGLKPA